MTGVVFSPLVPWWIPAVAVTAAAALLTLAFLRGARGVWARGGAVAVVAGAILNPTLVRETQEPQPDVAIVVVDDSPSQTIGGRRAQAEAALAALNDRLAGYPDIEVRVVRAETTPAQAAEHGTHLFDALGRSLADVPAGRLGGVVLITDGQIHDVPADPAGLGGPVHALLTGRPDEYDRRLVVERAPGYGIVGGAVSLAVRVEDRPAARTPTAEVRVRRDGVPVAGVTARVGRTETLTVPVERGGPMVVEIEIDPRPGELSPLNNRAAVTVHGVRDRLRVLLVSGEPHPGERTWRNLLKSDPAVDLVHFTILRPPEKDDLTPIRELALIAFPTQELFVDKLASFDMVVLDRYSLRDVLVPPYYANLVSYVQQGGALLLAVGPEFAEPQSLYYTPLGEVVPARPTGKVIEGGFRPDLTEAGRRHPVTAALPAGDGADGRPWGRWFRQVEVEPEGGAIVMAGPGEHPLVILQRVEKGRVALVASDHVWLWARGFEGGGPHAELIRRLAHWLMKEPELEEETLRARAEGGRLIVERASLIETAPAISVTAPSGAVETLRLRPTGGGRWQAETTTDETGLYKASDGASTALAAAGTVTSREAADLRATAGILAPVAAATGGGVAWIGNGTDGQPVIPDLRRARPGSPAAGRGWIAFRRNEAYAVTGVTRVPLLPAFLLLALALGGLTLAWHREGR
jgi:hypothetical protein